MKDKFGSTAQVIKKIFGARLSVHTGIVPEKPAYILLWVQQAVRVRENHALAAAILLANNLNLPLYAYFGLSSRYPGANARHFAFLLEGLSDLESSLEELGIPLVLDTGSPTEGLKAASRGAACLVCDTGYLRIQREWRHTLREELPIPIVQLETDTVVPPRLVSAKEEYSAATIRPKIRRLTDLYLAPVTLSPLRQRRDHTIPLPFKPQNPVFPAEALRRMEELGIDMAVPPVDWIHGGETNARLALDEFIHNGLKHYDESRNDPGLNIQSNLSPYLHFGQISPVTIAVAVMEYSAENPELLEGAAAFLEQLIVRRELAVNFCLNNPHYDTPDAAPGWARTSLEEHAADRKAVSYSPEILEKGETDDPYWNAAQHELVASGKMHGYMRMYWGKRVLEWLPDWREAYRLLLYLNDTYSLDGRDCNGYAGIAWVFGKHDRPFPERACFGKLRPMGSKGLKRKFEIDLYLARVENGQQHTALPTEKPEV